VYKRQLLNHPSIPAYLDHFELNLRNGKGFALVQTYIEGKSVESLMQAKVTFSEAQVKQIARALLEILVYLHRQQPPVVHRDIKPSNVLLGLGADNSLQQVYLIDFGSVQNFNDRSDNSFTVVGTYGYTPPEQLGGRAITASDLYSLGATLIALITSTHPSSLPQQGMKIDFERVVTISPELTQWLKLMTNPRIDQRFASAREALLSLDIPSVPRSSFSVPKKPADCKIRVNKDSSSLEILIPGLSGKTRLLIDQNQISLGSEVLGLQFKQGQPADRRAINRLECVKNPDGKYRIVIWAGTQNFDLGTDNGISELEKDWLAYELSNWLGIPIAT
jgi:serine/threonine protein kinase